MKDYDFNITQWIKQNKIKANPWLTTKFAIYPTLTNRSKGALGESMVRQILKDKYNIVTRNATDMAWDCESGNKRIEIKTSFENTNKGELTGKYMFNHISIKKNWDRLIICLVQHPGKIELYWFSKKDFIKSLHKNENIFKPQQGGAESKNDDYMIVSFHKLANTTWLKSMNQW